MEKTKVYDLPTRLFHGLFAGLFLAAFGIAKLADDESSLFPYHMILGVILGLVVVLRIFWGFFGSRYARFSSFRFRPRDLVRYSQDLLNGNAPLSLGHNPASSWAAILMMALALGLGVTGYLMATGHKEALEDVHELLANAFIIVVIVHVSGVILHTLRHRDGIALSMVSGKKEAIGSELGIVGSHRGAALLMLATVGAFTFHLGKNFDTSTQSLHLFGSTLQLGENEGESGEERGGGEAREKHEEHDED